MNRNTVLTPTRDKPAETFPVLMLCKCGSEYSDHPTPRCSNFRGDHIYPVSR